VAAVGCEGPGEIPPGSIEGCVIVTTPAVQSRATGSGTGVHAGSHIPALDGVRGLAVLLVMVCHFVGTGLPDTFMGRLVVEVADAGWSGVDLFFVLSGFLITGILYDTRDQRRYFRNFYGRRVLRIFPLYYGLLIFCFVILPHLHSFSPAIDEMAAKQGWLWTYTSNLIMARRGRWLFEADWLRLGHFWTLAIEEQFYLVWPLVVFLLPRRALIGACIACMVAALGIRTWLVLHGSGPITVNVLTFSRFDALAVGALAAIVVRGDWHGLFRSIRVVTLLLGTTILGLAIWRGQWDTADPVVQTVGFSMLSLFCAGLVILAMQPRHDNRVALLFSSPVLRWFGTYSYAMYVFHVPLGPLFDQVFSVRQLSAVLHSPYLGMAVYVLVATAITATVAYASWHVYEKHFLKLKRRFAPVSATKDRALHVDSAFTADLRVSAAGSGQSSRV
jgi:peptidoglycan/LPS O-acetylase OafA/YrhL